MSLSWTGGQSSALLAERPVVASSHALVCHRRHLPKRVVFAHVLAALMDGSGYERITSAGCSDRTTRRRYR